MISYQPDFVGASPSEPAFTDNEEVVSDLRGREGWTITALFAVDASCMVSVLAKLIAARNESSDVLDFCERIDGFIEEAESVIAKATGDQA